MKVDELIKHLENIKIDEDERREIAEYLARKISDDDLLYKIYIMTKDKKIYDFHKYRDLLKSNKISPDDAFVYVENDYYSRYDTVKYLYPFLRYGSQESLVNTYLPKLGFSSLYAIPAPGLKYVAVAIRFLDIARMVVEVVDIGTVAININLPTILRGILRTKHVDNYIYDKEVDDIVTRLDSQKLFAGYDFNEAWRILYRYYEDQDTSLAKEVEAIRDAYIRTIQPYRVVYDLKTKQFIPT